MIQPLSAEAIREAYARFRGENAESEWRARFLAEVRYVSALDEAAFLRPETQKKLWSLDIASVGQGEYVNVEPAYSDREFIDELYRTSRLELPEDVDERAILLEARYEQLLEILIRNELTRVRPKAKLARMLTAFHPRDFHTAYNLIWAQSIRNLVIGEIATAPIEAMVKCRQQLRAILGEEADDAEKVDRAIFCWHLAETKVEGLAAVGGGPTSHGMQAETELVLWPITKQRKGITAVKGYVETWRAVVNSATNGGTPADIVETMAMYGLGEMTKANRRYVFNDVRVFDFLRYENGLWHPSDDGLRLIEEDPADVLVERFLVRTWGLAQLLRLLRGGASTRARIYEELRARYANWKSDYAQSALVYWARSLDLIKEVAGAFQLTDYGAAWERRLPKHLPDPEATDREDGRTTDHTGGSLLPTAERTREVSFDVIVPQLEQGGLMLDMARVRSIHLAWHCNPRKRFVMLSGLSGTGKTAILKAYAEAYCRHLDIAPEKNVALVPVAPDWRDPTGLLGYHNALHSEPTWHREPALSLLLDASAAPDQPFFLILDEMNLAHVEQYFSPFLSAMETGLPIRLHDEEDSVNGVPPRVPWPTNLFIGGTLNMDETTHKISDKVLDRAFTVEFWDVDLDGFLARRMKPGLEPLCAMLKALHGELARVRRHFGYRTASEIIAFCSHPDAGPEAMDQAVYSKVLPRLRGDSSEQFKRSLDNVRVVCEGYGLNRCVAKLEEMSERLESHGLTHFWA